MFAHSAAAAAALCGEGLTRKILGRGGLLMMTEVTFQKGAVGALHAHAHEQVSFIAQGAFRFTLDGRDEVLRKGDSVYIGPHLMHGAVALEQPSVIVDVFTPQREDFLK